MTERTAFYSSLLVGVFVFVAIHFVPFKGSLPHFVSVSGGGALFDTATPHSTQELYGRMEAFGEKGRREYVFRNLTTDIVLPLSLLPLLILGTLRLNRRFSLGRLGRMLLVLPVMYVAFDVIENLIVIALISHYPAHWEALAAALPVVTTVKRISVMTSLLTLLGGLSIAAVAAGSRAAAKSRAAWFGERS